MKFVNLLILALLFISVFCTVSCTNEEKLPVETSKEGVAIYQASQQFILNRDSDALGEILDFIQADCISTKGVQSVDSTKMQLLIDFENERQIDDSELADYLENNPEEIDYLVKVICGDTFNAYFNQISTLYDQACIDEFVLSVVQSGDMSNLEKEMLMLFVSSEYNFNPMTRSLSSCIKRYAKLAEISVKSLAISVIDVQSGVEYAERELKNMGPEYDC